MNSKILKNNKGETLLEILVALAIVMLLVSTFYTIIDKVTLNNKKNEQDIKLTNIAETEMESFKRIIKEAKTSIKKTVKNGNTLKEKEIYLPKNYGEENRIVEEYHIKDEENNFYICNLTIAKEIEYDGNTRDYKTADMYGIRIIVSSEKKDFTKRKVELYTKVLGNYK